MRLSCHGNRWAQHICEGVGQRILTRRILDNPTLNKCLFITHSYFYLLTGILFLPAHISFNSTCNTMLELHMRYWRELYHVFLAKLHLMTVTRAIRNYIV